MADTTGRTHRRRHSALGIASLALSGASGTVFLLLVSLTGFLERTSGLRAEEIDASGLGLVAIFLVLACLLSTVAALALAAAALVRPGRGWHLPVVAWMVAASVIAYADAQAILWTPLGGAPHERVGFGGPSVHQGTAQRKQEAGMVKQGWGPQPASPPEAILSSARRDAYGFEGTFCWVPEWSEDCARDAGIPLLPEQETIVVSQGEGVNLVFVLRTSEGEFVEQEPLLVGAAAYPVKQEAKIVAASTRVGYLVPTRGDRALEKKELYLEREVEREDAPWTVVVGGVPEGEYVFQISARQSEDVNPSWAVAEYHFRVLVSAEA